VIVIAPSLPELAALTAGDDQAFAQFGDLAAVRRRQFETLVRSPAKDMRPAGWLLWTDAWRLAHVSGRTAAER
jgi:hypothetical protein